MLKTLSISLLLAMKNGEKTLMIGRRKVNA